MSCSPTHHRTYPLSAFTPVPCWSDEPTPDLEKMDPEDMTRKRPSSLLLDTLMVSPLPEPLDTDVLGDFDTEKWCDSMWEDGEDTFCMDELYPPASGLLGKCNQLLVSTNAQHSPTQHGVTDAQHSPTPPRHALKHTKTTSRERVKKTVSKVSKGKTRTRKRFVSGTGPSRISSKYNGVYTKKTNPVKNFHHDTISLVANKAAKAGYTKVVRQASPATKGNIKHLDGYLDRDDNPFMSLAQSKPGINTSSAVRVPAPVTLPVPMCTVPPPFRNGGRCQSSRPVYPHVVSSRRGRRK